MKIALVHEMLVKLGGAERVLKKLTDLFPAAPIYTLLYDKKATDEWFSGRDIRTSLLQKKYEWLHQPKFLLPKMSRAVEEWNFSDYDLVISSSSAFAHGIRTSGKTKHICYCHSPMRYAWDYTHEYTKSYSRLGRWMISKILHPIRQWDFRAASRPDVIFANSRHTQRRIAKYWRRESEVLYPPVNIRRFTPTAHHDNFFLIVSALTPFKRIDLAVKAFKEREEKLVIIGDGAQRSNLEKIAGKNTTFLGRLSDNKVREYYENCRAFIFPGEEDFGITPVEAMACGKPVLAYGVGGVTESVVPGVSGEFFNKPMAESLVEGLNRLIQNEAQYDPQKIRQIAEKFDETMFEENMLHVVKRSLKLVE